MDNPDYERLTHALDLDPERLRRHADFAVWRAERMAAKLEPDDLDDASRIRLAHETASAFARAASYNTLIHLERAMYLYDQATRFYRFTQRSFAIVTSICAGRPEVVRHWAEEEAVEPQEVDNAPETLVRWLAGRSFSECITGRRSGDVERILDALTTGMRDMRPTGRLRVPVDLHARVIDAARNVVFAKDQGNRQGMTDADYQAMGLETLTDACEDYLLRADEPVSLAVSDSFHWGRCQSSLLPVEPEGVAMATLAFTATLEKGVSHELHASLENRLPERARVPLELGQGIATAMVVGS